MSTTSSALDRVETPPPVLPRPESSRVGLILAFAAVYIIWGSTYLAIMIAVETLPPFLMAGTRHLVAGGLLYLFLRARQRVRPTRGNWLACAFVGLTLLLCGNGGVSWAERVVPSGVAALLVTTVSLWMVLIEWIRPRGTRPGARVLFGLAIGFLGVVYLVGPSKLGGASHVHLLGAGVLVFASFCWATGSVFAKHIDVPHSPLLGVALQSLVGGALLWVAGSLGGEVSGFDWRRVSHRSLWALAYLIVFGSWLGFTGYTYLLRVAPPSRVGTYAFVNPVVAMFLGWFFAGERITPRTLIAAAVILTAVILVITAPHPAPGHETDAVPAPGEA